MARRPGLTRMPLEAVARRLGNERAHQRDLYARLSETDLDVADPLAPLERRYRLRVRRRERNEELGVSETALGQLCGIAGVPAQFLERAPASVGLDVMRSMLRLAQEGDDRQHLLRVKDGRSPRLRAVLPSSYVRLDDLDVLSEVERSAGEGWANAVNVWITDDLFALRLVAGQEVNLGTLQRPDPTRAGIDVVSSETGVRPLEIRSVLFRQVCANGMTRLVDSHRELRTRYARGDRAALREVLRTAVDRAVNEGTQAAARLAAARSQYVEDPLRELEEILRRYRLGSIRGRIGRWVVEEVLRDQTLFGTTRFAIVQAFTAAARGLDYPSRVRFEDAMGAYLFDAPAA